MNMRFSEMYPSKYLKASDVKSGPRVLQIDGVATERMGDGEEKYVLYFHHELAIHDHQVVMGATRLR